MADSPTQDDWRFQSGFTPERLENLERTIRFEDIGRAIVREARVTALPVEHGREGELRGCRRAAFRVTVEPATFDQFFNGRDGYRGRFWQSPEIGLGANGWLLHELAPKLVGALGDSHLVRFATQSLSGDSATIWIHEAATAGTGRLHVGQWERTAEGGSSLSKKARDGRWAPPGTTLEVMGAFVTDSGHERIDPDKVERAMELHLAGYT